MNREILLNGPWEFKQAASRDARVRDWRAATVPGTIHTDLLALELIEEPFYRMNELDQRWIEYADWQYRRGFDVDAAFLENAAVVWLEFGGLDTFATIRLNGREVATTDNMFHPWRFEVKRLLKAGKNLLEVKFDSAPRIAEACEKKSKVKYKSVFYGPRVFIRKAQYAGGWDWGPRFMTCGMWRPVRLVAVPRAEIRGTYAVTRSLTDQRGELQVEVEVEAHAARDGILRLELTPPADGQRGPAVVKEIQLRLRRGTQLLKTRLTVDRPQRWWPAGSGDQPLYELRTTLEVAGETADQRVERVGLRTVELVRRKDKQGECFRFRVNGREIFCKGANWIPDDVFLPRVDEARYRMRLQDAVDANMNMIRVWGGGIYEDDAFYRVCDELGLMVWQDFMFACAEYPEDKPLLLSIRREAQHAVRALRNHPSLVLWCGNNENHWGFDEWWPPRPRRYGEVIYNRLLPAVCETLDPSRTYWPGSPWGGPKANHPDFGDQHVWTVWAWWANPDKYRDNLGRFVSEFGFQAMPCDKTVRWYTAEEDRKLFSPVIDHHNKAEDGHARICRFLTASLGLPRDLESYIYLSQVQQYEALKIGVEHWRRRWPDSAGALYWQLNDCWPVASWAAVDSFGRLKGLWYATRRFFAPALVSFHPVTKGAYGPTDLELWICHDHDAKTPVELRVSSYAMNGEVLSSRILKSRLPANGSRKVGVLKYADFKLPTPAAGVVHVSMAAADGELSENVYYFAPGRHIDWPDPEIATEVNIAGDAMRITLTSRGVARGVALSADAWEGRFSDNWFDLMPGQIRVVTWRGDGELPDASAFERELRVQRMIPTALG